jgi:hypothetical protein
MGRSAGKDLSVKDLLTSGKNLTNKLPSFPLFSLVETVSMTLVAHSLLFKSSNS